MIRNWLENTGPSPYRASLALNTAQSGVMDSHRPLRAESLTAEANEAIQKPGYDKTAGLLLEDWPQPIAADGRSPARPGGAAGQRWLRRRDHLAEATKRRQP